jgi:hypothetical protein
MSPPRSCQTESIGTNSKLPTGTVRLCLAEQGSDDGSMDARNHGRGHATYVAIANLANVAEGVNVITPAVGVTPCRICRGILAFFPGHCPPCW